MTNPILTPTEYDALCNILEWAWTSLHAEPELCLKDIDYSSASREVERIETKNRLRTEYEPTGIDPIKTGECGLGLADDFVYTLDNPDQENIMTMISTLIYKLNANPILGNGLGNSWETLAPLVDNRERCRLDDLTEDSDATTQTLEGYVVENIGAKNKLSRLQEHFDNVSEMGYIQVGEDLWIDGANSDIL